MKLRNKKTGEIISKIDVSQDHESIWVLENKPRIYRTLAELNEEWEDYKPAEPLIKDENIRKAVRAWAEVNGDSLVVAHSLNGETTELMGNFTGLHIEFDILGELEDGALYSIDKLCGKEEK